MAKPDVRAGTSEIELERHGDTRVYLPKPDSPHHPWAYWMAVSPGGPVPDSIDGAALLAQWRPSLASLAA